MKIALIILISSIMCDVNVLANYVTFPYGETCTVSSVGNVQGKEFTPEEPLFSGSNFFFYPLHKEHQSWRVYIYHKGRLFKVLVRNGRKPITLSCNEHGVMCDNIGVFDAPTPNNRITILPHEWNKVVTDIEMDYIRISIGSQAVIKIPLSKELVVPAKSDTWRFGFMSDQYSEHSDLKQVYLVQFICPDFVELNQFSPKSDNATGRQRPGMNKDSSIGRASGGPIPTREYENCTIYNIGQGDEFVRTKEQPFHPGARLSFYPLTFTHSSWELQITFPTVLYKITITYGMHLKVQECIEKICRTKTQGPIRDMPSKQLTPIYVTSHRKGIHRKTHRPNTTKEPSILTTYNAIQNSNKSKESTPFVMPNAWNKVLVEMENDLITIYIGSQNITSILLPSELHPTVANWSFAYIPEVDYQEQKQPFVYLVQFMCDDNDGEYPTFIPGINRGNPYDRYPEDTEMHKKGPSYTYTDTGKLEDNTNSSNTRTIFLIVLLITGCLLFIGISYFVYRKIKARNTTQITDTSKLQMNKK